MPLSSFLPHLFMFFSMAKSCFEFSRLLEGGGRGSSGWFVALTIKSCQDINSHVYYMAWGAMALSSTGHEERKCKTQQKLWIHFPACFKASRRGQWIVAGPTTSSATWKTLLVRCPSVSINSISQRKFCPLWEKEKKHGKVTKTISYMHKTFFLFVKKTFLCLFPIKLICDEFH